MLRSRRIVPAVATAFLLYASMASMQGAEKGYFYGNVLRAVNYGGTHDRG